MYGGLLAGVTTCGVLMAIFQSNAGGAWDNAKKMIEEQGKKEPKLIRQLLLEILLVIHSKDTSGPSLNILLKLMSVVALVIAPSISMKTTSSVSELEPANTPFVDVMSMTYASKLYHQISLLIINLTIELQKAIQTKCIEVKLMLKQW